ncbi:MFS transporter [Sulfodiicoccus acidiphilus]|uniref:MFS transporter n=1 Tax=Sulfodiicoccus acidiphilus TaxID=1670455 RepID=A0A348B5Z6_9CREN|nr:MFS transporter [Sulfodiicoccus acidiphilus]BBD73598.1 MFS transporter [Sulfodiicoccus acidiphilus]GGU01590.1 MFS transporter [Sulfodiicoccus acidiphilus]
MEKYHKYVVSTFVGVMLMTMDFELFLGAIPALIPLFHLSLGEITVITDVSFFVSAVAAFAFGALADTLGRKPLFMVTVLLYSLGSLFTAFSSTLGTLIFSRSVTSLGTGPDEPLGFTITSETTPPERRGLMLTVIAIAFPLGQALGAALIYLFTLGHVYLPYVFLVGVAPALILLLLRKTLDETDRFLDLRRAREAAKKGAGVSTKYEADLSKAVKNPFSQMFQADLRRKSVLMAIYTVIAAGSVAVTLISLPVYYTTVKHLSFVDTILYEFISFAIAAVGYAIVGMLGNKLSRRNVLVVFLLLSVLSFVGIIEAPSPSLVLTFNVLFVFFLFSQWAAWPFYLNEMYPTRVRATASNFGYGFQWLGNIVLPSAVTLLLTSYGATASGWALTLTEVVLVPLLLAALVVSFLPKDNPLNVLEKNAI